MKEAALRMKSRPRFAQREKCLSDKMLVIIADTFRGTHQTANSAPSLNESLGALNT